MSANLPHDQTNLSPHIKTRITGQKPPLKPREVWSIRIRLQMGKKKRDLALFNLAIDSKLRSCGLVTLRVGDIAQAGNIKERAVVIQQKTGRPVQFELTAQTRESIRDWVEEKHLQDDNYLFSSRVRLSPHLSARQYARILDQWVTSIGLDPHKYGTHFDKFLVARNLSNNWVVTI